MDLIVGPLRAALPSSERDAIRHELDQIANVLAARCGRTWNEPDPADDALARVEPTRVADLPAFDPRHLPWAAAVGRASGTLASPAHPDEIAVPDVWHHVNRAAVAAAAVPFDRHLVSLPLEPGVYLVPIAFPRVIADGSQPVPGGGVGSALSVFCELCDLAPLLGIELAPPRTSGVAPLAPLFDAEPDARRLLDLARGGDGAAAATLEMLGRRRGLVLGSAIDILGHASRAGPVGLDRRSTDDADAQAAFVSQVIDTRRLDSAAIQRALATRDHPTRALRIPWLQLFEATRVAIESGCSLRVS